jgi:hypothetical protein
VRPARRADTLPPSISRLSKSVFRNLFLLAAHHDSTRHTKMLFPSKTHDIRQYQNNVIKDRETHANPCSFMEKHVHRTSKKPRRWEKNTNK